MSEFDEKQKRIQALLAEHKLDALLLRRVRNLASRPGMARTPPLPI
jgi:hypothetical protein